jgi:hypothetical protein
MNASLAAPKVRIVFFADGSMIYTDDLSAQAAT